MFSGFSQQTSDFLWGLAFHNERPWFEAHRQQYEQHLLIPMRALAGDTAQALERRCPDAGFQLHISRIHRDARRLFGRGPYKDHMWFSLQTWRGMCGGPSFWFEVSGGAYGWGLGFFCPKPEQMAAFRRALDAAPAAFLRLAQPALARGIYMLEGEQYKRPKGTPGPELDAWYNRKWLNLSCMLPFGEGLYDAALPERLADEFAALLPLYSYFMQFYMPEQEGRERR